MAGRRVYSGRGMVALMRPGTTDGSRVGVTVSRQIKGSVSRNRARRRLREVSRLKLLAVDSPLVGRGIRYDVVLIARPAALELPFDSLEAEAAQLLVSLAKVTS